MNKKKSNKIIHSGAKELIYDVSQRCFAEYQAGCLLSDLEDVYARAALVTDAIVPKGQPVPGDPEKKGWLFKWTNYLKGYQRRWFVLSNGLLSYYRNQAEMAHTCRGTISLLGALIHTADSCTFVISNGGTQTFHIRANDEVERQSWVTALELAKAKAIRAQESDEDDDQLSGETNGQGGPEGEHEDAGGIARELSARFHDLRTCSELVARHGAALQRSLVDLEIPPTDTTKQVSERATLFRISCNAMMNACSEFMTTAAASSARMSRALQHERDQKMRLQEVVEQLARQHDNLEKTVNARNTPHSGGNGTGQANDTEEEETEFFDAVEEEVPGPDENTNTFVIKVPVTKKSIPKEDKLSSESESDNEADTETQQVLFVEDRERAEGSMGGTKALTAACDATVPEHPKELLNDLKVWPHVTQVVGMLDGKPRRIRVPDKPNYPLSLWSIMKNCIGKELSKIPIPVNFSEPLSMLQRLTEDYEYSSVLDEAARFTDPAHQLAYVAAFTVSAYSTTANRTNKPFNPLLGETYECDRMSDLGWRAISEQVSHHPPMVAQWAEGRGWQCWQEFTMTTKFRGKYLQVVPLGSAFAAFPHSGNKYSWRKVSHQPLSFTMFVESANGWHVTTDYTLYSYFRGQFVVIKPIAVVDLTYPNQNKYRWSKVARSPPRVALHCEGCSGWVVQRDVTMRSRFRGQVIIGQPEQCCLVVFPAGNLYTWGHKFAVMHHPPLTSTYTEGRRWNLLQSYTASSAFRGDWLNVLPDVESILAVRSAVPGEQSKNVYRYGRVTTTVHNIIVGKLWVDNHGDMEIVGEAGEAAGYVAHLKYLPYSYFNKDTQRKVTGVIKDPFGVPRYVLQGNWDNKVEVAPVTSANADNSVCKTGKFTVAWQRVEPPKDSDKWYNFTLLAAQLNEPEPGVAPTDSRLRPDQRLMEEGLWDLANQEKLRLEEKQRAKRRALEAQHEQAVMDNAAAPEAPKPLWFTREASVAPGAHHLRHLYNHRYWQCKESQDWAACPDIF